MSEGGGIETTCTYMIFNIQDPDHPKRKLPPTLDYQSLKPPPPNTRASEIITCHCAVCKIARMTLDYKQYTVTHSNKVGAPAVYPQSPPARVIPVCSKCLSEIHQGKAHNCDKSTKRSIIDDIVKHSSDKT